MFNEIKRSKENIKNNSAEFRKIFGVELKKFYGDDGLSLMLGFDIIEFNDWFNKKYLDGKDSTEFGKSLKDVVQEKCGDRAAKLLHSLI